MVSKLRAFGPHGKHMLEWDSAHGLAQPSVRSLDDALVLENISCVDADGKVFESYPILEVAGDIFRTPDMGQQNFTPYQAIVHCEE